MPRRRRDEVYDAILIYVKDHKGNSPGLDSLVHHLRALGYKLHRTRVSQLIYELIWEEHKLERIDGELVVCGSDWIPPDE